jgi:hypothetical protein
MTLSELLTASNFVGDSAHDINANTGRESSHVGEVDPLQEVGKRSAGMNATDKSPELAPELVCCLGDVQPDNEVRFLSGGESAQTHELHLVRKKLSLPISLLT